MNKILCPVDFSDTSLNAIEFAVAIAKKFHSKITLLHVFTERDFNKAMGSVAKGKSFKELLGMARNRLESLVNSINDSSVGESTFSCDYYLELGELIDKVDEIALEQQYELLVMGTTGVSRTDGIFFGSNTEDIIERVRKPILCIPEEATFKQFNRIVYGSDYLEEDKIAIQEVISFATIFDARIDVLHVNLDDSDKQYDTFTEELKSFITYKKISFSHKKYDQIGEGLNQHVVDTKSDLLVVFKRDLNFVKSIFSKSLTKTLAFTIDKPLLVLKLS